MQEENTEPNINVPGKARVPYHKNPFCENSVRPFFTIVYFLYHKFIILIVIFPIKLPKGGKRSWTAYNKYLDLSKYLAFALDDTLVPKYGTKIFGRGRHLFLNASLKFNPYSKVAF